MGILLRPRLDLAVVLLATLLSTSSAAESFEFIIEPSDTTAVQGATTTLYCSVNQPATTFMWVRDTVVISQTLQIVGDVDPSRYSVSYSSQSYNLIIEDIRPEDAGTFKCVAFSGGAGILSRNAKLEVSAPPVQEYPSITSTVSGMIVAGETIEVVCEIEGGNPIPEVELIKGNEVLVVASGRLVYVWVTAETDDGAVFECRAQHPLWTETRSSSIGPFSIVTESPNVVLAPSTAEITLGTTTSFVCTAAPAPRAVYRWLLNDEELENMADGSVVIDSTFSASVLHLVGTRETSGVVRCKVEAANGQSSAESTLTLIITEVSTQAPTTPVVSTERVTDSPSTPAPTEAPQETDVPSTMAPTEAPRETDTPSTQAQTVVPRETNTPRPSSSSSPDSPTTPRRQRPSQQPPTSTGITDSSATEEMTSDGGEPPIRGASSFNTIFVASVSAIASLIGIIFLAAIGAFCYYTMKRRSNRRADMYSGTSKDGDVFFRSRYIGIVRSWFSPVHRDTQKTLTSFEGPTPDQSPYNTITSRR